MTQTIIANLTDEQQKQIGTFIEQNHLTHIGAGLSRFGVSKETVLTEDDQNLILFWAGVLGDQIIESNLARHGIDLKSDQEAGRFVFRLGLVLRSASKAARRQEIVAKTQGAKVVSFRNKDGGRLILHRATRTDADSDWQLSTIGFDGIPWGHNNPPSFEEGLFRAIAASEDSYWNESGYTLEWADNMGGKPPC